MDRDVAAATSSRSDDFAGYSFSDYTPNYDYSDGPFFEPQQHIRGSGEGKTDANGVFSFSVPADVASDPLSQTFTLEATVTDQNGQAVGTFTGVHVHKGQFYIGMQPGDYVADAGDDATVSVVSIDPDGKPVPDVRARVSVFQRQWRTVRERDADGQQHYRSTPQDTFEQALDVTTGGDGKGTFTFRPSKSGEYYVLAESTDSGGQRRQVVVRGVGVQRRVRELARRQRRPDPARRGQGRVQARRHGEDPRRRAVHREPRARHPGARPPDDVRAARFRDELRGHRACRSRRSTCRTSSSA